MYWEIYLPNPQVAVNSSQTVWRWSLGTPVSLSAEWKSGFYLSCRPDGMRTFPFLFSDADCLAVCFALRFRISFILDLEAEQLYSLMKASIQLLRMVIVRIFIYFFFSNFIFLLLYLLNNFYYWRWSREMTARINQISIVLLHDSIVTSSLIVDSKIEKNLKNIFIT